MLRIENTNNIVFMNNSQNKHKTASEQKDSDNKNNTMLLSLAGLASIGAALVGMAKCRKTSFEDALVKNGVQIKDGLATLIKSGEKYTGKIERYVNTKKETFQYIDGIITEKIYHNALGRELEGSFYKNGILRVSVGNGKVYSMTELDKNNKVIGHYDCKSGGQSKFENARDMIKKLRD